MDKLVIANIIAFIASLLMIGAGYIKSKDTTIKVISIQTIMCVTYCLLAGNFGGAIANCISLTRNLLYLSGKLTTKVAILICAIGTAPVIFSDIELLGKIPIGSSILSTYNMFTDKNNVIRYKTIALIAIIFWAINDYHYGLYTSFIADICFMGTNLLRIIKTIIENSKDNKDIVEA